MVMKKWDWSISFVRMVAMCFIITCHFLQFYSNELAWWFNVGVQMFLFISGLVFSNQDVDIMTLKKQFTKILLPYYIFVVIACIIWLALSKDSNVGDVFSILLLYKYGKFTGLHHLWFISYILLAYVMTPTIIGVIRLFEKTYKQMLFGGFLILISILIFFELFATYYNPAWMICYFLGLFMGRLLYNENPKMNMGGRHCIYCIAILAVISNCLQIVIDYYLCFDDSGLYSHLYERFTNYAHVLLGITLVFLLRLVYIKNPIHSENHSILKWSDKYSYYIYLVHQIFILGCFSICALIHIPVLAIVVSVFVIIAAGMLLNILTEKIMMIFKAMKNT